jgi:hypothetical protein
MTITLALGSASARRTIPCLAAAFVLIAVKATVAQLPGGGPQLEWDTELTSLNLTTPAPVPIPLASDPGNALGDSISGYGFVDSQVTVTLSSQRPISPGPPSLGQACASAGGGSTGQACFPTGNPQPINPNELDGEQMTVSSFFDVFFDITVTDIDARPGRDYAGQLPGASFVLQNISDAGNRDMISNYQVVFDADAPNFGLLPPPETFPYIGHFNIEIPLGGDINGNGENDKIKFTLAAHQVNGENRTFIILPDGTVVDNFDSEADLSGLVVDESTDPPFTIHMVGPSSAESLLLNPVVPEPASVVLLVAGGLLPTLCRTRRSR